jgi:hypothetical protein
MRSNPEEWARPASMPEDVGRLVQELAIALRRPADPEDFAQLLPGQFAGRTGDAGGELPQILKPKLDDADLPRLSTWRVDPSTRMGRRSRLSERVTSSVPRIFTGLAAIAMLAMASAGAINSFASLNTGPDTQIAAILPEAAPATAPSGVTDLVDQGRRMIDRGNIAAARSLLERAAKAGEPAAMMALAETLDPNMLAAWGARGLAADPRAAREHYAKAHSAGIASARQRLEALKETP